MKYQLLTLTLSKDSWDASDDEDVNNDNDSKQSSSTTTTAVRNKKKNLAQKIAEREEKKKKVCWCELNWIMDFGRMGDSVVALVKPFLTHHSPSPTHSLFSHPLHCKTLMTKKRRRMLLPVKLGSIVKSKRLIWRTQRICLLGSPSRIRMLPLAVVEEGSWIQ